MWIIDFWQTCKSNSMEKGNINGAGTIGYYYENVKFNAYLTL